MVLDTRRAQIWVVGTKKGGVLKTSITTNIAGVLAKLGHRVLLIDTDSQGDCLVTFGINPDLKKITLFDLLVKENIDINRAIVNVHENIDVIPSNASMDDFEIEVIDNPRLSDKYSLLKKVISKVMMNYDYIIIDTPANTGLATGNALAVADQVLIPFQPEPYSMRALSTFLKSIVKHRTRLNPHLHILGVVGTLVDMRTNLHTEIMDDCRKFCAENGVKMFTDVIPKSIRFASTISQERKPATLSDAIDKAPVSNYYSLMEEIMQWENRHALV